MLCADDLDQLVGGVGVVGVGQHVLGGVVADGVFVAAQDADGVAADAHSRPGDEPCVDGVADRRVCRASALGAHIALGGEAGHQIRFGGLFSQNRAPGNRLFDRLQVLGPGVEKEVHMGVDKAGKQRGVTQVNDLGPLRVLDGSAHGADALALDQNFARLEQRSGVYLEQPRRVEHDGRVG